MNCTDENLLAGLGTLLWYPDAEFTAHLNVCVQLAETAPPEVRSGLMAFAESLRPLAAEEREELYARTFDINPVAALEIGWHLFGEEYHRGALLVRLRQELRRHGIEEVCELPDHPSHVLCLLGRMTPVEAAAFARACVIPALEKMLAGFAGKENPYECLLRSVAALLAERFPQLPQEMAHGHGAQLP